jgi:hypothetical protein
MRPGSVTIYALMSLLLTAVLPGADAHRSGCHRWHSCPSDRRCTPMCAVIDTTPQPLYTRASILLHTVAVSERRSL